MYHDIYHGCSCQQVFLHRLHHQEADEFKVVQPGHFVHQGGGVAGREQAVHVLLLLALEPLLPFSVLIRSLVLEVELTVLIGMYSG